MFRYETRVIKESMKPDQLQEFEEMGDILYYQGRVAQENRLKTQDLGDSWYSWRLVNLYL